MEELIRMLDKNLIYIKHEIKEDTIIIFIKSKLNESICPYSIEDVIFLHLQIRNKNTV